MNNDFLDGMLLILYTFIVPLMRQLQRSSISVIKAKKAQKLRELNDSRSGENFIKKRLAFLDLLLDEHFKNPQLLPEEDIREEVDTFMFEVNFYENQRN